MNAYDRASVLNMVDKFPDEYVSSVLFVSCERLWCFVMRELSLRAYFNKCLTFDFVWCAVAVITLFCALPSTHDLSQLCGPQASHFVCESTTVEVYYTFLGFVVFFSISMCVALISQYALLYV